MKKDWRSTLLPVDSTIGDLIESLDKNQFRIVLIVDAQNRLMGTVTDGDIRRALLRDESMSSPSSVAMEKNPTTIGKEASAQYVLQLIRKKELMHLPVVDDQGKVIDLKTARELLIKERQPNPVLLMAGGLGKRLRPLTNFTPKPLLRVGEKPILQTTLERLIDDGFERFFISVNYRAEQVQAFFGDGSDWGIQINYLEESEPLGTAGAISLLKKEDITQPLLVMNADLLTKLDYKDLLNFHQSQGATATLCVRSHEFQIPYGVVHSDLNQVVRIEEKPSQNFFVNAGIYVFEPSVLTDTVFTPPCDMPTVLNQLVDQGAKVGMFPIHEYWIDVGSLKDLERAQFDVHE